MYEVIREYKVYLEKDCRFTHDTIINYMVNLPEIFKELSIYSIRDIDSQKISYAWRIGRWEPIQKGIQLSEAAQNGYLLALKEFLRYLEEKGYNVEQGISEIIKVDDLQNVPLKGLTTAEEQKLHDFLVFNVNNDLQRKETALMFLIWATGCRLNEALALNVGNDGLLFTRNENGKAGDFEFEGEKVYVHIKGVRSAAGKIMLPYETVNYLNFYLENRKFKSPILFVNNARVRRPGRLANELATNLIERVLRKADINVRNGQAVNVLRSTAMRKPDKSQSLPTNILHLNAVNSTHNSQNSTILNAGWDSQLNHRVA
jgi:site-specific recombinase XerD